MDYIILDDDITITELKLTSKINRQTVLTSGLRKEYKLNIIALEHEKKATTDK